jgi:transposase-like protein
MTKAANPFRYFNSSLDVIRLVVMMYIKYPLSLRNVEDLLAERGICRFQLKICVQSLTCQHPKRG